MGRSARLELTFVARDGRTVLGQGYAEPPLRVGPSFARPDGLHIILASSAPGVFGGDEVSQRISLGRGAQVLITSQSALQLHPALTAEPATIATAVDVADDASLTCLLEPLIPFRGAALQQRIGIHVARSGTLIWSDAMMCGREGRGERWQFALLDHELRLDVGGSVVYLERFRLSQAGRGDRRWWSGAEHAYFGTLLAVGLADSSAVAARLHARIAEEAEVDGAADVVEEKVIVVRLASRNGAPFHRARRALHESLSLQKR